MRILVLVSALLSAGWDYVEHVSLGTESYRKACDVLRAEIGTEGEPALRIRLGIACDNLHVSAQLYGQATALAGDRFGGPADFLSTRAGWKASSRKQYYALALGNSTHFHPYATREWWRYHSQAVGTALDASKKIGLDAVNGLQLALFEAAFADHFLHDAYSAGHMGFNRSASSAAASLVYHDQWNDKGRVVRDRAGRSWKTYGDGHLDSAKNADGRTHAVRVATLSIEGVLRAFVVGTRNPDYELEIWRALPFVIDAPELQSLTDRILGVGEADEDTSALHPLEAINWPARKDRVIDFTVLLTGPLRSEQPTTALLVGYYISLPRISAPLHIGAGITLPNGSRGVHFAGEVGFTAQLGLTNDGLLDHHLSAGALWDVRYETLAGSIWGGYLLNVELGRNVIQLQIAPAFVAPAREFGFTASLGFARVLSAAGGGVR
ncbi:MAG: hypothetical protein H0T46_20360 [Deltaproteobacteria bacterium]|nr:hypothetical protein [Deltaproteobacteria bacterium]